MMNEEQQIAALEAQIEERERLKKEAENKQKWDAFWKGDVRPVMWLFILVMSFLMLHQCSVIRIG